MEVHFTVAVTSMPTVGYIVHFRLGAKKQNPKQAIIEIPGVKNYKEAAKYLHKKVIWETSTGKKFIGFIRRLHGRKGRVIAYFRRPLPGQAVGTPVTIV